MFLFFKHWVIRGASFTMEESKFERLVLGGTMLIPIMAVIVFFVSKGELRNVGGEPSEYVICDYNSPFVIYILAAIMDTLLSCMYLHLFLKPFKDLDGKVAEVSRRNKIGCFVAVASTFTLLVTTCIIDALDIESLSSIDALFPNIDLMINLACMVYTMKPRFKWKKNESTSPKVMPRTIQARTSSSQFAYAQD